ncbi:MAG: hypothetical protein ACI8PZ_001307 [Myxococcota bacterium]|jgi:hypothetical protein
MSVLFWLLAAAQVAHGAWFENAFYGIQCDLETVKGTPSEVLVQQALVTNAATYGAAQFADEILLPNVSRMARESYDGKAAIGVIRADSIFGIENIPARGCGNRGGMVNAPVDLMTNRLGLAWQGKYIGVFYAVTVNGYGIHPLQISRATAPYMLFVTNFGYGALAPLLPAGTDVGERFTMTWDWIGGLVFAPGGLDVRLGYVGSKGFYSNVDEEKTSIFLRSVLQASPLTGKLNNLPYLMTGLDQLPIGEDAMEKVGRTRIYGRRLRWYTIPGAPLDQLVSGTTSTSTGSTPTIPTTGTTGTSAAGDGGGGVRDAHFDLYTFHIEQIGLANGWLDLKLIGASRPAPLMHEASVGVHSPGYDTYRPGEMDEAGFGVWVGVVTMPPAWHYGSAPGPKPTLVIDAGGPLSTTAGYIHGGVRMNQTEVLDIHPYAINAVSVFLEYVASRRD